MRNERWLAMVGLIAGPVTNLSNPLFYVTGCSTADWPKLADKWRKGAFPLAERLAGPWEGMGGRIIHIGEVYG